MRERAPVAPETLFPRRLAVRALGLVLRHYNLADTTLRLNPDDPEQAFPGPVEGEVRLYLDGWDRGQRALASVFLDGGRARVVIDRVRELVRPNHRKEFRPEDVGIATAPGLPDVDMEVDVQGEVDQWGEAMRTAPQRLQAKPPRGAYMWPKGHAR